MWRTDKKLLTAVTLVYNKLDFASRTVSSFLTYNGLYPEDYEYVLWDNDSKYPGVADYLNGIRKEDQESVRVGGVGFNVGVGAALNRVLESTESEFLFKLDDDTMLLPMTLPMMILAYTEANKAGFPIGVLSADVMGVGKANPPYDEYEIMPGMTLQCTWCVGGGAVLIGRHVFDDVGLFREDRLYGVEDAAFAQEITKKGYKNAYLKGAYHMSFCRGEEADKEYDDWKLVYHAGGDLCFEDWKQQKEQRNES